jgi:outer membrane cobalamin receptor
MLACLQGAATCQATDNHDLAGRRVVDVLADTAPGALRFLYSTQLLPDSLRVQREPEATSPIGRLREVLAAHRLGLVLVSPGLYAVTVLPSAPQAANKPAAQRETLSTEASASAPDASLELQITGERHPYGLKLLDDAVVYSATRLSLQPSLGEDAMYTLSRLPGMSQGDLSGQLNIRGGQANETLVLFDGFPIREAFHMPGYRSLLSIFDASLLSSATVYTGAIPARYGDRMSGVVEFRSIDADEPFRNSVGAGFLSARARSLQSLGDTGADMLVAVRGGSTGYLLRALQPAAANPRYGDGFARLRLPSGPATQLTFNALHARDELVVERDGLQETSRLRTALGYYWLHSTTTLGSGTRESSLDFWIGNSQLDAERAGTLYSPGFAFGDLAEHRRTGIWDLRAELRGSPATDHAFEAGIAYSSGHATYSYRSIVDFARGIGTSLGVGDSNQQRFELLPRRRTASAYLSDTWSLRPGLTTQLGLRLSRHSAPESDAQQDWDPRLLLAWQALPSMNLRAGWGRIHQVSDLNEIIPGRDPLGRLVGQQTEYALLGLDKQLPHALQLRIDAFHKQQLHLLPLQRNLLRTPSILPELSVDRTWWSPLSARIRGIELNLQQSMPHWHWVAAYTLSKADETYPDGRQRRSGDQGHVGSLNLDWTRGNWLAGAAFNYRSGLPTTAFGTDAAGNLVIGKRNAARLPDTTGLDLRATWRHPLGRGTFRATAQVSNLLGNDSSCCSELAAVPGSNPPALQLRRTGSLPPVPWIGVAWDF